MELDIQTENGPAGTEERFPGNPLLSGIRKITTEIAAFKERIKAFYFEVLFSTYKCPICSGQLHMTSQSECTCSCGNVFDPTTTFQKSICCNAGLVRKTFHYVCSSCRNSVPSRFLFDEKLFDRQYFKDAMAESRTRAKNRREEIARFLAESRSETLPLMDEPELNSIPGLIEDLTAFIRSDAGEVQAYHIEAGTAFDLNAYRDHILSCLGWDTIPFSDIPDFLANRRKDRVHRFIALIFMQHERLISLTQDDKGLLVRRVYHETYN